MSTRGSTLTTSMTTFEPWLRALLAALAVWRLTHLFGVEDGPFELFARLRAVARSAGAGGAFDCFYCLSLWFAAPVALLFGETILDRVLAWLALSGAASLLERVGAVPVAITPLPTEPPS